MKKLTVILTIIFVILALMLTVYIVGGTLFADVQVITAPASDYPEAYASIVNVVKSGSAPAYFSQDSLSDSSRYTLMDVTIHLTNPGFFPVEWLEITTGGVSGDIAVYSLTGAGSTIDARSTGQVNLKLITAANAATPRIYTVNYYVLGMKRSVRIR